MSRCLIVRLLVSSLITLLVAGCSSKEDPFQEPGVDTDASLMSPRIDAAGPDRVTPDAAPTSGSAACLQRTAGGRHSDP